MAIPAVHWVHRGKATFYTKIIRKINKSRAIKYFSHKDGYIHSFYSFLLSKHYEETLSKSDVNKSVIGYRKGLGSIVVFAKDAFNTIRKMKTCTALAFDISDFFPSIGHSTLLRNLKAILNTDWLSADWFSVYKFMTKFSWIEIDTAIDLLDLDKKICPAYFVIYESYANYENGTPAQSTKTIKHLEYHKVHQFSLYFPISL